MPYRQPGSPYWYISFSGPDGRRVRESSGTPAFEEAKALEAKRRVEVHQLKRWGEKPPRLFEEVLGTYLAATTRKRSHVRDLFSAANLRPHFTGRVVSAQDPEHVEAYIALRRSHKPQPCDATIAKELLLYSAAVTHCNKKLNWDLENPVAGHVPKVTVDLPVWLTKEQADDLIEKCRGKGRRGAARGEDALILDFVELGLATGMRSGEMVQLEWSRVDFGARLIYFRVRDQKSKVPGSIPLNDWACAVLRRRLAFRQRHCERAAHVFTHSDGERVKSLKKAFARAAEDAGLTDATPHTLRHTFAAWLVQAGVPLRTVQDLLRHKDIKTTLIYAHLAPENTREAVKLLDQIQTASRHSRAGTGTTGQNPVIIPRPSR